MSIIDRSGNKVVLPRVGPDEFWAGVIEICPEDDPRRWRNLAMLALRENAGWPLDRIGIAFGHTKGHVARCVEKVKEELRERLGANAEWEVNAEAPDS